MTTQTPTIRATQRRFDAPSLIIALNLCTIVVAGFMATSPDFFHWFVIPVWLCGVLVACDAINWLRGKMDTFDPTTIVALLGLHFFFLAPLLHVYWDFWGRGLTVAGDWRHWLGLMASMNAVGIIIYQSVLSSTNRAKRFFSKRVLYLNYRTFVVISSLSLVCTALLQLYVYSQFGGIMGYINSFEERAGDFVGLGWVFALSESFPKIAIMLLAATYHFRKVPQNSIWRSWFVILGILVLYFAVIILFGGLRGSRSNTLWSLVMAVGIIHFWIRRIPKLFLLVGLVFFFAFMYVYGFYKSAGLEGVSASLGPVYQRETLEQTTGRTLEGILLADLARSDIQAFILSRLESSENYEFGYGRTYLGALSLVIPRSIWPDRPETKVKEGTNIQHGQGAYRSRDYWVSSRIYGLSGEAMLNFGVLGIPLAFFVFGLIVSCIRRAYTSWQFPDSRLLLYPFLPVLMVLLLGSDSDNVVFYTVKNMTLPLVLVLLSSRLVSAQRA